MPDQGPGAVLRGPFPCRVIVNHAPDRLNDLALRRALDLWRAVRAGYETAEHLQEYLNQFPDNCVSFTAAINSGDDLQAYQCPKELARVLGLSPTGTMDGNRGSPIAVSLSPIVRSALDKGTALHALLRRVDDPRAAHWQCLILPDPDSPHTRTTVFMVANPMEWELLEHLANSNGKALIVADRPTADADPEALFANHQAERLLGLDVTEIHNRPLEALLPKDWWGALEKPVTDAIDLHAAGERDFTAANIETGWLHADITGITQGCVIELARLQAADSVRPLDLKAVVSNLPVPMTVVDIESMEITYYNRAAEVKFGLPPAGMTSYVSTDFYADPKDRAKLVELLRANGHLDHHQVRLRNAKGRPFWALLMSRLVIQDGREINVSAILDIEARHMMESELRRLATTDQLTGVTNRAAFMAAFERELARVVRTSRPLCLTMIDLDHFKSVNDTYGHQTGDDVLRSFAARLRPLLRTMDVFGRLGGEEFALLLPECELEGAEHLADRLRLALAGDPLLKRDDGTDMTITASFGVTLYAGVSDDARKMLHRADLALYAAKAAGRNSVETKVATEV